MARRIEDYHVRPPEKTGPDAHDELERLLETLHAQGVLRFANDLVASRTDVLKVLVGGLEQPGTLNALQNLSILGMALSRIPPADFYRVAFALRDALAAVAAHRPDGGDGAPGMGGTYRLLHDDDLWRALAPLLDGLKAFRRGLEEPVEQPISHFSGKQTGA